MNVEVIYYTLVAAGLYFMCQTGYLTALEVSRGERFKNRSVIFFLIILTLAFISFSLMKYLLLTPE